MRISTSQYFGMNVQQMDDQQSTLAQLYQQLSSGVSLSTPSDNPVGASQAVQLSMHGSVLSQYSTNQNAALSGLQAEDSTLTDASTVLTNINTLLVRAGDGSLSDSDRSAIATNLQGLRNQLVGVANSTDGTGNYLFAGFQTTTQPFSVDPAGVVQYNGDNGVQNVQVSNTRQIAAGDNGQQVFLGVAPVGNSSVPFGNSGNSGSGTIGAVSLNNASNVANSHKFQVDFTGASPSTTYTITDLTLGTPPSAAQPYTSGTAITLGGQSVAISGAPNAGDSFQVIPATQSNTNVFSTIDSVVAALQTPVVGTSGAANLTNALATAMTKIGNTMNNIKTIHASVGGRENEIQALQTVTQSNSLQTQSNLADLTTTNLTQTISKYTMVQFSLQAAQQGFSMIQKMSLFNYIGN